MLLIALDALLLAYYFFLVVKSTTSAVLMIAISVALCAPTLDLWACVLLSSVAVCLVAWSDKGEIL